MEVKTEIKEEINMDVDASQQEQGEDGMRKLGETVQKMEVKGSSPPIQTDDKNEIKTEMLENKSEETTDNSVPSTTEALKEGNESEYVTMTAQEIAEYVQQKAKIYLKDPEVNTLLALRNRRVELENVLKAKNEDINKLMSSYEQVCNNQEKFLRDMGVYLKIAPPTVPPKPQPSPQSILKPQPSVTPAAVKSTPKAAPSKDPIVIDLTDESEPSSSVAANTKVGNVPTVLTGKYHQLNKYLPNMPPIPTLTAKMKDQSIVLQWDMPPVGYTYAKVTQFEIYNCQQQPNVPLSHFTWKLIGTVDALSLPMACTLNQFVEGYTYHFSVRAVDAHKRVTNYCQAVSVKFQPKTA